MHSLIRIAERFLLSAYLGLQNSKVENMLGRLRQSLFCTLKQIENVHQDDVSPFSQFV
jgi:uncharacterized protein (UPF0332 family)